MMLILVLALVAGFLLEHAVINKILDWVMR